MDYICLRSAIRLGQRPRPADRWLEDVAGVGDGAHAVPNTSARSWGAVRAALVGDAAWRRLTDEPLAAGGAEPPHGLPPLDSGGEGVDPDAVPG